MSRGDISVYVALLVVSMMLTAGLVLGMILSRQIALTQDVVASERAFYAANSGLEEAFYRLNRDPFPTEIEIEGEVSSNGPGAVATYDGCASRDPDTGEVKARIEGSFQGIQRRLVQGDITCS